LIQKWPEDALKRSADFLFEEINAPRNTKKIICKIGMDVYQKALLVFAINSMVLNLPKVFLSKNVQEFNSPNFDP